MSEKERDPAAGLWSKGAVSDAEMLRYTARDDATLDRELLPFDLRASIAHVRALGRIGALTESEAGALVGALEELTRELAEGRFGIAPDLEDGHTAIELELTRRLGETGKRVHLGRSRNDQVLVAMRLWEKDRGAALAAGASAAAEAFLDLARTHRDVLMPGYTHLQRAMPQSLGHWALAYAEGFLDAAAVLDRAVATCDKSPLGAAAGYGVNLPLDRDGAAAELGFAGLDVNPLWSQTSRGLSEVVMLTAAWHAMAVARRLAWDLSLFTTAEFAFVELPDDYTTGSSIMPQKRNPDVVELMRAACSIVQGAIMEVMSISSLPSGYHRDLQLTKGPVMRAMAEAAGTLRLVPSLVSRLRWREDALARAVSFEMLATDRAVSLTREGMPFRDAYKLVGTEVIAALKERATSPVPVRDEDVRAGQASLRERVSPGAPGELLEARIAERLRARREHGGCGAA